MELRYIHRQRIILLMLLLVILGVMCLSCASTEQLCECNYNDRIIVGYSKNMKKYKVINACNGLKETPVRIDKSHLKRPGEMLISNDRRQGRSQF
jgi:hypothetical protein